MSTEAVANAVGWLLRGICMAFSVMALAACTTVSGPSQIVTPPVDLMAECPEPRPVIVTNEDLTNGYLDMRFALRKCNANMEALRSWSAEVTKDNPED